MCMEKGRQAVRNRLSVLFRKQLGKRNRVDDFRRQLNELGEGH